MGKAKQGKKPGHNKEIGKRGEDAAARFLEMIGFDIIERNWTCPAGEADIIAFEDDVLVFVEVKTRTSIEKGFPSEAVDAEKRRRYENIACWFLKDFPFTDIAVRFDVAALVVIAEDRAFIRYYRGAYEVAR